MKYLAAYSLCALSGSAPTKKSVEAVLKAAGVDVDKSRLDALFTELEGKELKDVVSKGRSKIVLGAAGAPVAAAGGAAPAAAAGGKAAAKVEEPEEEEDDFGMGGLF